MGRKRKTSFKKVDETTFKKAKNEDSGIVSPDEDDDAVVAEVYFSNSAIIFPNFAAL